MSDYSVHPSVEGSVLVSHRRLVAAVSNGARYYWRLGETFGRSIDQGGGVGSSASYGTRVGQGRSGAIAGDPDGSVELFGAVPDGIWQSRVTVDTDFANLPMTFRQPFAYEIWARPRSLDGRSRRIFSRETATGGYLVAARRDATVFARYARTASGTRWSTISAPPLPRDAWTHVVAHYDGTTMRLYANGTPVASAGSTLAIPNDPPLDHFEDPLPLRIGAHTAGWLEWDGWLDEPAYYGAISAAQVLRHYRIGRGEPAD